MVIGGGLIGKKKIDQEHCPVCGKEFDVIEPAVHMDARGPFYAYCACDSCRKAWEIGQFRRGSSEIGRREVEFVDK